MAEIEELDDTAQRLRVLWRKTNNFYASFASILFDTKKQFTAGMYPGWEFDTWLIRKAGLSESNVMQQLKVFSRVIHAAAREEVERDVIRQAVEKRKAKQAAAAERRAAAAERRVIAAHKKREQEQARAERARLRAERQNQPLALPAPVTVTAAVTKPRTKNQSADAKERQRQQNVSYRTRAKEKALAGPENPVLRDGLAECQKIEATSRVELGRIYVRLKEEVDMHRAGKSPADGKLWTWGSWSSFYLKRSRSSIKQCISDYSKSLLDGQIVANSQPENVVNFPRSVGEVA